MDEQNTELLCMGCMEMRERDEKCKKCGFDEGKVKEEPHHLPMRTILAGKYLVGYVLGEGGFGITYIGWDLNIRVKIAIKEYYPTGFATRQLGGTNTVSSFTGDKAEFFAKGKKRFVDEARTLGRFYALPGIVSVRDFFYENETAYIVMEYVDGMSMKTYLERMGGKLPVGQVLEMMKPVMNSLLEVHKAGLIHRDISPDNVMITAEGNVKLIDFGAARDFEDSGNKSLSVMVKPGYAPEEQYRSHGVQGPWTDIYALCATLYRMITGVKPDEANERVLEDQLKRPSMLGISIAPNVEEALMKGLAVRSSDRYQSLRELFDAIYNVPQQSCQNISNVYVQGVQQVNNVYVQSGQQNKGSGKEPYIVGNEYVQQEAAQHNHEAACGNKEAAQHNHGADWGNKEAAQYNHGADWGNQEAAQHNQKAVRSNQEAVQHNPANNVIDNETSRYTSPQKSKHGTYELITYVITYVCTIPFAFMLAYIWNDVFAYHGKFEEYDTCAIAMILLALLSCTAIATSFISGMKDELASYKALGLKVRTVFSSVLMLIISIVIMLMQ